MIGNTTSNKQKKKMTDKELEKRIDQRIQFAFQRLSDEVNSLNCEVANLQSSAEVTNKSISRIERVLLGDVEYDDEGFVKMIKYSYDATKRIEDYKIAEKALEVADHYTQWNREGKWEALDEIIKQNFMTQEVKRFFNVGSWAGILALITSLGGVISFIIYLYKMGLIQ